jgi:hypothetical protein
MSAHYTDGFSMAKPLESLPSQQGSGRNQAKNHIAQPRNMVKLISDVELCYQMLLTEANAKAALFKAEEMLRAALADAKEPAVLKANGIGGE